MTSTPITEQQAAGTSVTPVRAPVITAWSAVSPLGMGAEAFTAGLRAGRSGIRAIDEEQWTVPVGEAALVEDFTPAGALGKRGTRSMDRATALAVTAVGMLLEGQPPDPATGLVLGTSNGSVASMMGFTRDSLTRKLPYHVDPAQFPNTVMNCAAGQSAIWHGLTGPNTTVAGGHVTGLLALNYAVRLQRCGHVDTVACGAVEEFSAERAWLDAVTRQGEEPGEPPGEGCAVFLLEPAAAAQQHGRDPVADVLAIEIGAWGEHASLEQVLGRCLRRALDRAGTTAADVWAVCPSGSRGARGEEERSALASVLGAARPRHLDCAPAVGDTVAASGAFQLAAVLATGTGDTDARDRVAVVTSVDRDGICGCALVRTR